MNLFSFFVVVSAILGIASGMVKESSVLPPQPHPLDGPWIVHVKEGHNDRLIDAARAKHTSYLQKTKEFNLKFNWKGLLGFHAIVIDGVLERDLLNIPGVMRVEPDLARSIAQYSWGNDRLDQANLPLSNTYTPIFGGCGVDVYVLDTGLDTLHSEFAATPGITRTVENIYNVFGAISTNTDVHGHGSHCAGTIEDIKSLSR